jgi:putative ABC transport system ATP-binding protein
MSKEIIMPRILEQTVATEVPASRVPGSKATLVATAAPAAAVGAAADTAPAEWESPSPRPRPVIAPPIIQAVRVSKRYVMSEDNYVDALRDASLDVAAGEMIGVMGPSGSGKSTLLHILGCLDSLDSGQVWLDSRRVDNLGRRNLATLRRTEIGFIFQTFNLIPSFTAIENVVLAAEYAGRGRREARGAAHAALAQVGLSDREDHRPTELSGGQQQRVAIARAMVNGPKVVFGDEPTGNLDSQSSAEIVRMMREINEDTGTTFVLVTHDPGVAEKCDRVIHMLDGRVS